MNQTKPSLPRRSFLTSVAAAAAAVPFLGRAPIQAQAHFNPPDAAMVGGFYLGCQCWTFNKFSVMEAIEFTARAGGKVIEFFPGQRLSKEEPGVGWGHDAPESAHAKVKEQLEKWKVVAMNYGVVGIPNDEAGARKIFEFAKRWNLYGITTESDNAIDLIEKLVKEYDIRVCYHNHPRRNNDPSYKVWDPKYIAKLVEDRDPRVGACGDTGHWIRTGLSPVESLKILKGRVHALHLKDRPSQEGLDVVWGSGMGDVAGVLAEVRSQGFRGNVSVEYETNWDHNITDAAQCLGYVRGLAIGKGWS
jgi:sugar phosphate isomerase/epimerase